MTAFLFAPQVLILENGRFGYRQVSMCKVLGISYHHESFGERSTVDHERVAQILADDSSFTHNSIVHCETSTGIFNDVFKVGEVIRKHIPGK